MATKRKTTTAIVAGATALALLLGGTFAWTSISQQAKNETAGIVNVGGRLHDDFDGTNKDVYVENFTDPLNGGQPIYARIKLTEYMEVGQDAGGFGADVNGDGKTTAVPVVNGTSIDDKDNWPVHIPAELCATCENGDTCMIHDHWTWVMGGQTTFMPTFNKDKDSLAADINGTYHGTNDQDKIYYDDYVEYTTDETGGVVNEADKEAYDGKIHSVTGDAYYDDDADNETNDHDNNVGTFKTEPETHTAKETADGSVILMKDWDGQPGNYWVYDTDGWAYWANPIMPGEATGLLLDGINMTKNPGEKCYYAINVVAQFATVGDWNYFNGDEENPAFNGTDAAKELLDTVSKNVATVTVTNTGAATLKLGESTTFSASVSLANGTATQAAGDFEWSVLNGDLTENTDSKIEENADGTATLTVGADETSKNLIIVAKATNSDYLGALGMTSIAVNVPVPTSLTLKVNNGGYEEKDVEVGLYTLGQENIVTIRAIFGGVTFADDLVWTVVDGNGNELTNTTWTVSENKATGTLVIDENETANEIVVTATYTVSNEEVYTATYRLLSANFEDTHDLSAEPYVMLTSDGSETGLSMYFVRTAADMTTPANYAIAGRSLTAAYAGTGNWYNLTGEDVTGLDWSFNDDRDMITSAVFINKMQPLTTKGWFYSMGALRTITDLKRLDTSEVTTMASMFQTCESLVALDVSTFDTSKVTLMGNMFLCVPCDIKGLENFDTSSVTDMGGMFFDCDGITNLDLSGWDVGRVENFIQMFDSAINLTSINAENWDTSSATHMAIMFRNCTLLELDCSQWDVSGIDMSELWGGKDDFSTNAPGVTPPTWPEATETTE